MQLTGFCIYPRFNHTRACWVWKVPALAAANKKQTGQPSTVLRALRSQKHTLPPKNVPVGLCVVELSDKLPQAATGGNCHQRISADLIWIIAIYGRAQHDEQDALDRRDHICITFKSPPAPRCRLNSATCSRCGDTHMKLHHAALQHPHALAQISYFNPHYAPYSGLSSQYGCTKLPGRFRAFSFFSVEA